jgi:O-antigen/teichoic acid export membrane protein
MTADNPQSSGDHAIRGLRWVAAGRIVTQAITWSMTIITVRFLHPEDYGVIATAGLFTALAMLLLDGGLGILLVTQRDLTSRAQGAVITATLISASVLGAIIAMLAPVGSWFFRSEALTAVLLVSAIYMPLAALAVVPQALLTKSMQFRPIAITQTIASLVQGATSLALAVAGVGYWALIVGNFAGTALRVFLLWRALEVKVSPNMELALVRPLVKSSSHMVGTRLTYFVANDFDTFLISRIGGVAMAGPYSLAKQLCHSALDQLSAIVNQVMVPLFASKTDRESQVGGLLQVITITATLMFPLFWMLGVVSRVFLPMLFGDRWAGLILPFVAFSLILPLRSIYAFLDTAVMSTGRTGTTFRNMLVWAGIMMPLLLVGALVDVQYVALVWTLGFPLVFLVAMRRISTALAVELRTLCKPLLAPVLCAAASCLAMLGFSAVVELPALVELTGELAIGGGLYWLLMWRFGRSHHDQIFAIIRRLLGRRAVAPQAG